MTIELLKPFIRRGELGVIPGWKGYLKWDFSKDLIKFVNNEYTLDYELLYKKIYNRNDLYYII